MSVHTINEAQFEEQVLSAKKPVVVEFFKYRSDGRENASNRMSKVMDDWASSETRADFVRISLVDSPVVAEHYAVQSAPTLLIFSEGEQVEELIGYYDVERPKVLLDRHL